MFDPRPQLWAPALCTVWMAAVILTAAPRLMQALRDLRLRRRGRRIRLAAALRAMGVSLYEQYAKSDGLPWTRRNLRESLIALNGVLPDGYLRPIGFARARKVTPSRKTEGPLGTIIDIQDLEYAKLKRRAAEAEAV